jgi:DNA-binding transcriptional LysR family regulator
MDMDIKSIEAFVRLCKDKNISTAAGNLYLTQQGLSKIIKRMEDELGTTLFVRKNRGVELTQMSKMLLPRAEAILSEYNNALTDIKRSFQQLAGTVNVVLELGCLSILTPQPFLKFLQDYPFIDLRFGEHRDSYCHKWLLSGEADIAIVAVAKDDELFDDTPFFSVQSVIYIPKDHPLAKKKVVTIEDLRGVKLLLCGSTNYYAIMNDCKNAGFEADLVMCTTDINVTMQCLQSGLGVSPFILGLNKAFTCPDDIVVRPLSLLEDKHIYMLTKKGAPLSECATLFKDYFVNYYKE